MFGIQLKGDLKKCIRETFCLTEVDIVERIRRKACSREVGLATVEK